MKTTVAVLTGAALGFFAAALFTPMSGSELRRLLFSSDDSDEDDLQGHTFSINELVSPNSSSLESIKEKIEHGG